LELIFLLRVQLVGELGAGGYIRIKGTCDIRSLNAHSESWTAIKAPLTTGLYLNVCRYSMASCDVRAQFHYESTLLFQESKMQASGLDSYFGPPYIASSSMVKQFFPSLLRHLHLMADLNSNRVRPSFDYFGEMHVRTWNRLVDQRRVYIEDYASNAIRRGQGSAFAPAKQRNRSATDQRVV
jgi:hypothetical protein